MNQVSPQPLAADPVALVNSLAKDARLAQRQLSQFLVPLEDRALTAAAVLLGPSPGPPPPRPTPEGRRDDVVHR